MALAKCGWHQNDMHCGSSECNVFVCANVHVHSLGFHYSLRGDGWIALCLFAVWLLSVFIFPIHFTRHAIYSSLLLITCWGFQTWKYTFYSCYFTGVEWRVNPPPALTIYMNEIHISGLFHTKDHIFKNGLHQYLSGTRVNLERKHVARRLLRAAVHRSERNKTHSRSFQTATERTLNKTFLSYDL